MSVLPWSYNSRCPYWSDTWSDKRNQDLRPAWMQHNNKALYHWCCLFYILPEKMHSPGYRLKSNRIFLRLRQILLLDLWLLCVIRIVPTPSFINAHLFSMPSFVATHAESGRSKENELLSEVYVVAASVCAVLSLWAVVCFVVSVSDAFFWQPFIINIAAIPITSNVAIFFYYT